VNSKEDKNTMSKKGTFSQGEMEQLLKTDPWWMEISDEIDRVYSVHQLKDIVSDEQKHEVVEAMFEYLLISEEDLARAETDPIFQEAKGIIAGLKTNDVFPKKLIELYESKIPEALNRIDNTTRTIISILSIQAVRSEVEALWMGNRSVFGTLDMNNLPPGLHVSSPDDRYILRSVIRLQELDNLFRNYDIQPLPSNTYTPAAVSRVENDQITIGVGAANENAEQSLNQRARYLAYRIYDPLWHHQIQRFEPEYVTFRLKWINDSSLLDHLYEQHKKGKDVISVFMSVYANEERLARLNNAISSCPVTSAYGVLFSEVVNSYRDERFSVAATALLPMIEGIIWEFAWWWNNLDGGLFDRPLTHEEFKEGTAYQLLKSDGSKVNGRPNVGKLLRQTKFGEEVYFEVVEYLVVELFEERNPTLHGREPSYGTKKKAAALLFVIETLERQITGAIKRAIGKDVVDWLGKSEGKNSEQSLTADA
jgi:hypothetical protein